MTWYLSKFIAHLLVFADSRLSARDFADSRPFVQIFAELLVVRDRGASQSHGPLTGSRLAVGRILRCHPFHVGRLRSGPPGRLRGEDRVDRNFLLFMAFSLGVIVLWQSLFTPETPGAAGR